MSRVIFDIQPQAPQVNTGRADVACFVGLVRLLAGATLSSGVAGWLQSLGYSAAAVATLTNVPIPIEAYATFTTLFDDGTSGNGFGTDYVATAVRSFFAQGGKKCYVLRVDDPVTTTDLAADKATKLNSILGATTQAGSLPDGPAAWTGVAVLGVLEEVSLLVVPDLSAVSASAPTGAAGQTPTVPLGPQEFTLCSPGPVIPQQQRTYQAPAPRLAQSDFAAVWAPAIATILNYLAGGVLRHQLHLREIQFVAAFPLLQDLDAASADIHDAIAAQMPELVPPLDGAAPGNISSAFLQLGYPWLKTAGSNVLLEQLEPPDGALAGLIARNALTRGTFTSATKIVPADIYDVSPVLPMPETRSSATALQWNVPGSPTKPLIERFSLFGMTAMGLRLLSDVTAYPGEQYRSGPVNRLVSVILRAARIMGESAVFHSNGPALWGRVQQLLQNLMARLWSLNALDGATPSQAFSARCDRTTMTQNNLDNGQLIAAVTFTAAATLETIRVQLAMEAGSTSAQEIAANASTSGAILGNAVGGMAGATT